MPAPPKNRNATRHGLKAGTLPAGASYVKRDCDALRRCIEAAVVERHGEIALYHAACIQSAIRWERHAMLAQRWLRLEIDQMDPATKLSYSREIARASAERDKCLEKLGLDKDLTANAIDVLYSRENG
ncbi:MAG: hypothetical protein RIC55_28390 [Pirellulaceae bacterium]